MYTLMLTNYLPKDDHSDHSELFFKYRRQNEILGVTKFKRDELFDAEPENNRVIDYIKAYFNSGIHYAELNYKYFLDPVKNPHYDTIAGYPETCALTRDYLKDGSFYSPLNCKWHPIGSRWIVHPGRTRCRVLHYFLEEEVEAYAFNTQGIVTPAYTHVFNSKEDVSSYMSEKLGRPAKVSIYCTAAFDSLLPDVILDEPLGTVTKNFLKVTSFFRTTKIHANFDLGMFDYCEEEILKNPRREITVKVHSHDPDTLTRAMMILPCHSEYEGYGITIKT